MRVDPRTRWAARSTTAGAALLAAMLAAGPAVAEPSKANPVASVINQIADVDQTLTNLSDAVATRQEGVNKALVDFQNAVAARQLAVKANSGAKSSLNKVSGEVERAQRDFDSFVRSVYRQGNNRGAMTKYVASDDPDKVLEQMSAVERVTGQQQRVIRKLQVARNQQANRVAATEITKRQSVASAQDASDRRDDAVSAYRAAQQAMRDQQTKRTDLLQQRDALAARLAKLRGKSAATAPKSRTTTPGAPQRPLIPGVPKEATDGLSRAIDAIPAKPVEGDDVAAQAAQAAAKLATDTGQSLLASLVGQQQIPHSKLLDEIGIGGTSPFGQGEGNTFTRLGNGSLGSLFSGQGGGAIRPGLRGPQAIEVVVNRMKSQLGVPYSWGGGDANGPTLGVRDGGVADSYGDYQKVGFDCSGLMVYGFAGVGIDLPKYSGYQYTSGPQFPLSEAKRGDMIFYGPGGTQHVALVLGDGTMLEAPQSGSSVKISPMRTAGAEPMVVRLL
ncbi:NlpC/P60 family protein [Gordonia sp. HY002]|uniref:NlpC/P60 family protein n=1 Tax=Gordonia zhenghanii TaxID=2911516 RepID=UPI001EF0CE67|nr:NlpC/P60 family protein [Gordonia zhenghanii]MCF8571284.1 NlpC/P60 family protein [Gordonia zhenghanii]MCF8601808.1 NlpC/P60 family protein [Gordonia zhenghanii]